MKKSKNIRNIHGDTKTLYETRFSDYEYFTKWECDENITKYMSFDENRSYEDVVTEALYSKKDPTKLDYTIVARENGKPVGRIYIWRIGRALTPPECAVLYWRISWLRNGLGREIMHELLEYCFTFLHMERVTLDHYAGNRRGAALYERLGFKDEGTARNAAKKDGKYYDLHLMSIMRSEFFDEN